MNINVIKIGTVGTSTSLLSDIIVEGFKDSITMHTILYNKLISGGVSSVSKKLQLAQLYSSGTTNQKFECRNHV